MSETSDDTQRRCRFWVSHCKKNIFLLAIISFISGNIFFFCRFSNLIISRTVGEDSPATRRVPGILEPFPPSPSS